MNDNINIDFNSNDAINIDLLTNDNINIEFADECVKNYPALADKPRYNGKVLLGDMDAEYLGIVEDKNYVHNQTVASDEWIVVHNLNKYPAVSIIDSANNEVVGEVIYDNVNQVTIKFVSAFKGKATLN